MSFKYFSMMALARHTQALAYQYEADAVAICPFIEPAQRDEHRRHLLDCATNHDKIGHDYERMAHKSAKEITP